MLSIFHRGSKSWIFRMSPGRWQRRFLKQEVSRGIKQCCQQRKHKNHENASKNYTELKKSHLALKGFFHCTLLAKITHGKKIPWVC